MNVWKNDRNTMSTINPTESLDVELTPALADVVRMKYVLITF